MAVVIALDLSFISAEFGLLDGLVSLKVVEVLPQGFENLALGLCCAEVKAQAQVKIRIVVADEELLVDGALGFEACDGFSDRRREISSALATPA